MVPFGTWGTMRFSNGEGCKPWFVTDVIQVLQREEK